MMHRIAAVRAVALALAVVVLAVVGTATARPPAGVVPGGPPAGEVCPEEGKIELDEDVYEVQVTAGTYCVKAGSVTRGCGAVEVTLSADGLLRHPCGKAISHYTPASSTDDPPAPS